MTQPARSWWRLISVLAFDIYSEKTMMATTTTTSFFSSWDSCTLEQAQNLNCHFQRIADSMLFIQILSRFDPNIISVLALDIYSKKTMMATTTTTTLLMGQWHTSMSSKYNLTFIVSRSDWPVACQMPQTILVFYTFVGWSQLADHLANKINQDPYYVQGVL